MSPPGMLEDQAARAVDRLAAADPATLDVKALVALRLEVNCLLSKAMEAQNAVKAAE